VCFFHQQLELVIACWSGQAATEQVSPSEFFERNARLFEAASITDRRGEASEFVVG
jgi:hypothetical protein